MSQSDTKDSQQTERNYRKTLNLPKTSFPMKANLVQNEPASIKRWAKVGLYEKVRAAKQGKKPFVFHDGPPYANGSLHLGHMMNKSLKDFVVRHKAMAGFDCPYVPGWDCHGLPIEHKVMTGMVESGKAEKLKTLADDDRRMAVRRECQKHAAKHQKQHTQQLERLLTMGDYANPYLTMTPDYEGAVLEVLASMLEKGLVYRALKAVHWSIDNETALADAELEYEDREDISVFVDFEVADAGAVYGAFGLDEDDRPDASPSFMIWTTTPWTLPANVAVAVNPRFTYALVRLDGNVAVLAEGLVETVAKQGKADSVEVLATCGGEALLGLAYKHPFRDAKPKFADGPDGPADDSRVWTVLAADYVTLEDGTGLVHTATGHGAEDYTTGVREGLPVYCPVLEDGTYDKTAPEWLVGKSVWEANEIVTQRLRDSGHLFHDNRFMHSYPHDWRSKTPVIFRATEQWFVGVERDTGAGSLRSMALEQTASDVKFVPEWGRNRMRGMLESRPDWCISRQRSWGLPIPAFYSKGETFMTAASVRAVAKLVRERGSDAWYQLEPRELLAYYDPESDPDAPADLNIGALIKGRDILDVWFESGSSWNAVMRQRLGEAGYPVALYLEGSDQHRGWFQLSLMCGLGVTGESPFKTLLTHGFMVNKDGRKLSKSSGDTIDDLFQQFGADVLRWWVSSLSYENDVKVDKEFFALAGESYRKVRNTMRFLLSNLDGFDPAKDGVELSSLAPTSIDAWALGELDRLTDEVTGAFERYAFVAAHKALYQFCNDTLSSVYLAAVKDRLYCDKPGSDRRRATQTALHRIADQLCRLLAPVLAHTADEAFRAIHGDDACVHTEEYLPKTDVAVSESWGSVFAARDAALNVLEKARADTDLDNPLDAGVTLAGEGLDAFDPADLADLLGVSRVDLGSELKVHDLSAEPRCERSWKRDGTVKERSDGGMLSDRDAEAVGVG